MPTVKPFDLVPALLLLGSEFLSLPLPPLLAVLPCRGGTAAVQSLAEAGRHNARRSTAPVAFFAARETTPAPTFPLRSTPIAHASALAWSKHQFPPVGCESPMFRQLPCLTACDSGLVALVAVPGVVEGREDLPGANPSPALVPHFLVALRTIRVPASQASQSQSESAIQVVQPPPSWTTPTPDVVPAVRGLFHLSRASERNLLHEFVIVPSQKLFRVHGELITNFNGTHDFLRRLSQFVSNIFAFQRFFTDYCLQP